MKKYVDKDGLAYFAQEFYDKTKDVFATKAQVGSPLAAATVAGMTDTDKIYVYTGSETGYTAGDWYYYDGSDWVSGGVYNSAAVQTDTSLSVAGMAADAKTVGDDLDALDGRLDTIEDDYVTESEMSAAISANVDATLSVSGKSADAKAVGDAVAAIDGDVDSLNEVVFPRAGIPIMPETYKTLPNVNQYESIPILIKNNKYKFVVRFDTNPTRLSNIRTSKTESSSGNVDLITDLFVGDSWTAGKTLEYTPNTDDIKYLQFQFNSAYEGENNVYITVYDITAEERPVTTDIVGLINETNAEIDGIKYVINLNDDYNLLPPDGYEVGKYISTNGVIRTDNVSVLSDYIELDPSQSYICNWAKTASVVYGNSGLTGNINTFDRLNFCFFDEDKNVIVFSGSTSTPSKAIPQGAKYIRVTVVNESVYPLARLIYGNYDTQPIVRIVDYKKTQKSVYDKPNTGFEDFKMVMFGDSITHGSLSAGDKGISYVNYANDYLHSDIINVGFGGTRMTYPTLEGASLFQFRNLVDCIVSEDANAWDDLIDYATNENTTLLPHLNALMAVDWSKVEAIGLMYGANDFTSNTPVGASYNETITNFDGACASSLKKLLTKYPHLQVLILAPFDRMLDTTDPDSMTDTTPNRIGLYMSDYANSLENVVSKFHCPLIKTGELFGINAQTILTYAPDGTHPRANIAQKRLGWLFAKAIENNLAPFNG